MPPSPDTEFVLIHRGRPVGRALLKLGFGSALGVTGAVIVVLALLRGSGEAAAVVVLAAGFLLVWGGAAIIDGSTDLIARSAWRSVQGGREMRLNAEGVRYSGDFRSERSFLVPWPEVADADFRLGPEGSPWYCLSTDSPAYIGVPGPDDFPRWSRRIAENLVHFGTPLAVNLEICDPAVRPGELDRAIRSWTDDRLRCRPPEPAWWVPPVLRTLRRRPVGHLRTPQPPSG